MASEQNDEISIAGELTETGVRLNARSRALGSIDRLLGNAVDALSLPFEERISRRRARMTAEKRMIETLAEIGVKEIQSNPGQFKEVMSRHFDGVFRKQENKEETLLEMLHDLRRSPPSEEENGAGPEILDDNFTDRVKKYAEDATTDELRQKWGRVLAAEVRRPGTFSARVLRAIDELEGSTAALFENACKSRVGSFIPAVLLPEFDFETRSAFVEAGLINDPGALGVSIGFATGDFNGIPSYVIATDTVAISFPSESRWRDAVVDGILVEVEGGPGLSVIPLSSIGRSIATILPDGSSQALVNVGKKIAETLTGQVYFLNPIPNRPNHWQPFSIL